MSSYFFNYSAILGKAMQQVVYSVLSYASENGLPGKHHFYITFSTRAPGVILPQKVLQKHEEQITIVLQHEFYSLKADSSSFEVELVFDGVRERVRVPFDALVEFSDPHSNFSMQFEFNEWHDGDHCIYDEDDDTEDEGYYSDESSEIDGLHKSITEKLAANMFDTMKSNDNVDELSDARDSAQKSGKLIFIDDYLNKG